MEEKKKMFIVLGILLLIIAIIGISSINKDDKKETVYIEDAVNYITYDEYKNILNGDKNDLVVLVQTGCGYCEKAYEEFKKIYSAKGYVTKALNIRELSNDDMTSFMSSIPYLSEEEWGTPLLLVLKNGELIDTYEGYASSDNYLEFLVKNGIIGE